MANSNGTVSKGKRKVKYYHWEYDDGQTACATISDSAEKKAEQRLFKSKEEFKAFLKQGKRKKTKDSFKEKKLKVEGKLENITKFNGEDISVEKENDICSRGAKEFLKLLQSCGEDKDSQREVIKLVSGILAGYRFGWLEKNTLLKTDEKISAICCPVIICKGKVGESLFSDLADSLMLKTAPHGNIDDNKIHLAYHQPSVLPTSYSDKKTIDCAYIWLKKDKEHWKEQHFPAQYHNTAVYLKTQFFTKQDLIHFQRRNCRATLLLSGCSESMCLVPPICVDNKICKQYNDNSGWDKSAVKDFIILFVRWLSRQLKKNEKEKFSEYFQGIQNNNQKHGTEKIRGLYQLWLQAQLYVMEKLAEYGARKNCWSHEERLYLAAKWKNLLLPGVCTQPKVASPLMAEQTIVIPEMNGRIIFEETLKTMLNESNRYIHVPECGEFPGTYHDRKLLGYVRIYHDRKTHSAFLALQIKESIFVAEAPRYSAIQCDWYKIIKALRKEVPPYLHPTETSRMPTEENKKELCRTLILKIDKLQFLPECAKNTLLNLALVSQSEETV